MLIQVLARQQRATTKRLLMKHHQRRNQQNQYKGEVRPNPVAQGHLHRYLPALTAEWRHVAVDCFCYTQTAKFRSGEYLVIFPLASTVLTLSLPPGG